MLISHVSVFKVSLAIGLLILFDQAEYSVILYYNNIKNLDPHGDILL